MARFRIGFIGTGKPRNNPAHTGYGMAYDHAEGYRLAGDMVEFTAAADIVKENAELFATEFGVARTYLDYHEMLAKEDLDIVSVCTWPHLHEQMVVACAEAGVRAVHCEKPMAKTWGEARHMAEACEKHGVKLTFNHMRRFAEPIVKAKELLDAGKIGELRRVEFERANMCDYGSHMFDLCNMFNGETDVLWMLAQIDYRTESLVFGAHQENQAVAVWRYKNDVMGLAVAGRDLPGWAVHNRLVGTEGVIEILWDANPVMRARLKRSGSWKEYAFDRGVTVHGPNAVREGVVDVVNCLAEGRESVLCGANALRATELIFAAWESSRRRGRVDLPLDISDNPLEAMVASGDLKPQKPNRA